MKQLSGKQQKLLSVFVSLLLLLAAYSVVGIGLYEKIQGLSIDLLLSARSQLFQKQHKPQDSNVVVVAIDEETYEVSPFASKPKITWTPQLASIQNAIIAAEPSAIGYDIIYATSLESLQKGYDKPFLKSLHKASRKNKIVLGYTHYQNGLRIHPFGSSSFVVQNRKTNDNNMRPLNMVVDSDDVIRRIPVYFASHENKHELSMAAELAARKLGQYPQITTEQQTGIRLADHEIPVFNNNSAYLNFQGDNDIPTYSLADMYWCAEQNRQAYFEKHFKDKIVIFGVASTLEDRKYTSNRFMNQQGIGYQAERCTDKLDQLNIGRTRFKTIPGVYIHAVAINDLIRGTALQRLDYSQEQLIIVLTAALIILAGFSLTPRNSFMALISLSGIVVVSGIYSLQQNIIIPALPVILINSMVFASLLFFRFAIADQQKRLLRKSFEHYVSPAVVEQMVEDPDKLKLSGEYYQSTVVFTDLEGFTSITEALEPMRMRSLLTEYFSRMVDVMLANQGTLDKFIGDAMMCFFGVPVKNQQHPLQATRTAWEMYQALKQLNQAWQKQDLPEIRMRIGVNSGRVVAGNMGTDHLFNYTVMGDSVNLGARLESANKFYGTHIMLGQSTAAEVQPEFVLRELDRVTVKGKKEALKIYELMGPQTDISQSSLNIKQAYEEALQLYYAGEFIKAADIFGQLIEDYSDNPSKTLLKRCRDYAETPPVNWDGIYKWQSK